MTITIEDMASFCKRKGFVYPTAEVYGGLSGFFDFGPAGVELKNNIKAAWWQSFVHGRQDIAGMDGSIITHPSVWKASGHVGGFADILVECGKCNARHRADHLVEDKLKIQTAGMAPDELSGLIRKNNLKCPKCGNAALGEPKAFNLMFETTVGPTKTATSTAYLRPETAQLMFADFRLIAENARLKLPFGIAQVGKAYRNEISPRDFLFRMREFELMEIEYFVHPGKYGDCPFIGEVEDHELYVYSQGMQKEGRDMAKMSVKDALQGHVIKTPWHAYWMATMHKWFIALGAKPDHFRIRQHVKDELSHYAFDTWDLEYQFPFGWKELQGFANRTDFDLTQHMKHSKADLSLHDEETKKKVIPHVICEPAQGVERAALVFLFDGYEHSRERENIVLHLHPKLAPIKAGIFPLVNKEPLIKKAKEIYAELSKEFHCAYDQSGTVGRRYARNDELGTPFCITVDFEGLEDGTVTIRDRDSTTQARVPVEGIRDTLRKLIEGASLEGVGKIVSGN
ncbi:TPA: glycine--tRNA ligase [Candidatus Woesearchaeota archaeon]|nr:glycine--tRNA ligase [Candidatus Woesearchaeota archaeon]HIH04702.1 glycine--tRNA ligase [Candidatus Woesearchaeota archaeon]